MEIPPDISCAAIFGPATTAELKRYEHSDPHPRSESHRPAPAGLRPRRPARQVSGACLAACLLIIWGLASGCAAEQGPGGDPIEPLLIGTSSDYPPFSTINAAGERQGFSIDLGHQLAQSLGRPVEWVDFEWPKLSGDLAAQRFDFAISGITWRAERALVAATAGASMSRALATGGPCVVGAEADGGKVAVNRGGILERWTRLHYDGARIVTVDDNLSLPRLLEEGQVSAFVTDRFEIHHFAEEGWPTRCEPPADRKAIWIAPGEDAEDLGEQIDHWLDTHENELRVLRRRHFGDPMPRSGADHLVDLLARRLAFMPWVARIKKRDRLPIEDLTREARVLSGAAEAARRHGLDPALTRSLFETQIALAKRIQVDVHQRFAEPIPDHVTLAAIRTELLELGDAILEAVSAVDPDDLHSTIEDPRRIAPIAYFLDEAELNSLLDSVAALTS